MKGPDKLRIACIGAGYFARFQVAAWKRIPEVDLIAICDRDEQKAKAMATEFNVPTIHTSAKTLFENEQLDVIDIITPPDTHFGLCELAAKHRVSIICQKPVAPTLQEAENLVKQISAKTTLMIHENFRFQPWYQKIREMLKQGVLGDRIHSLYFQTRTGDGWQPDAYMARQPYFRTMPRLLIYETGIHFIDTFRYLLGEVEQVYADLRTLNDDIAGEDCGMVFFRFRNGARAVWDANRYNESKSSNPRYTFGEMLLEGNEGTIRLYYDGSITFQPLGQPETPVDYHHEDIDFGGDCVYFTQKHLAECLISGQEPETDGTKYLQNLHIQEAIYESARLKQAVQIADLKS